MDPRKKPEQMLLCAPTDWPDRTADSVEGKCAMCEGDIVISKSGMKFLRANLAARPVCVPCGLGIAKMEEDPEFQPVPGALEEIAKELAKEDD